MVKGPETVRSHAAHHQGREPTEDQLPAEHDRGQDGVSAVLLRVPPPFTAADLQITSPLHERTPPVR